MTQTSPDRRQAPPIRPIGHFAIAAPERRELRNGMPLNVINAGQEDVVRFDLVVKGGQWSQEQPLQAVFTNRMLREGTKHYTSAQISERLDYYGAWLDLTTAVNYGFVTLYSLGKYFSQTLALVASMVKEPTFPEAQLDIVRNVNRDQYLINRDRVEVMSRKQLNRSLFGPRHPLGVYAEADDYDRVTTEVMRRFYHARYYSGNCSAYVSGRVTPGIVAAIEREFGDAPWGRASTPVQMRHFTPQTDQRHHIFLEKDDALQSSLRIGGFLPGRKHPDFLKLRVLVTLLGGYFGSRLMSNIREEKGYTYGISSSIATYPGTGVLVIATEADSRYVDDIITEVYREMERLREEKVPEGELDMVRHYMLGDLCRSYESAFSLSDAWIFIESAGLDAGYFGRTLEAIREVNVDELLHLARKYLCKESLIEVVAGKKTAADAENMR